MGQEIATDHFSAQDWQDYALRLCQETALLRDGLATGSFSSQSAIGGFELEGWLVDDQLRPKCCNQAVLKALNSPLATVELAQFNLELNTKPLHLQGDALSQVARNLQSLIQQTDIAAQSVGASLLLIGILPTAQQSDFCLATMTDSNRYHALNNEVLKARNHRPLNLAIDGQESLNILHHNVMLEAATTSFQVHFQVPAATAHHFYNAAMVVSGPIMAVAANSPFLFGRQLWQESRIPVFEQAVDAGRESPARVSFGSCFADKGIGECFEENLSEYPVLLPMLLDKPASRFAHLRLHNGVIWRWNRPLVGFDADGTPHIRLEHRILPAGPSVPDMLANAALFYGLAQYLGTELAEGEPLPMAFATARENFYNAARKGLDAQLRWHRQEWAVADLLLEELLPLASAGLEQLGIDAKEIRHYLSIIAARIESGQTGAKWQQKRLVRTSNMQAMLADYKHLQSTQTPVHTWALD